MSICLRRREFIAGLSGRGRAVGTAPTTARVLALVPLRARDAYVEEFVVEGTVARSAARAGRPAVRPRGPDSPIP
jgi:hypothetical protein